MKKAIIKIEKDGYYSVIFTEYNKGAHCQYFLALKRRRKGTICNFLFGGKHIMTYGFGFREPSEDQINKAHNYLIETYT